LEIEKGVGALTVNTLHLNQSIELMRNQKVAKPCIATLPYICYKKI